jgi:hypothetical protein
MAKLIVRCGMRPEYYGFLALATGANGDEIIVDRRRQNGVHPPETHEPGFEERRGRAPKRGLTTMSSWSTGPPGRLNRPRTACENATCMHERWRYAHG